MNEQYKIIGGDGREYGPVTLEELKSWVRDGRVAATTHIWRSDINTWMPAGSYVELQSEIGPSPATQAAAISEVEPAGFWVRLGAYIIDAIVLGIVTWGVWGVISQVLGWQKPDSPDFTATANTDPTVILEMMMKYFQTALPFLLGQMFTNFFLHMIYDVSLNGRFGATLGKMVVGARIVRLDNSPIGYGTAFLRFLAARLSDMVCYIGYLFIAFRGDKRAMHDLIVGTKVIYKR